MLAVIVQAEVAICSAQPRRHSAPALAHVLKPRMASLWQVCLLLACLVAAGHQGASGASLGGGAEVCSQACQPEWSSKVEGCQAYVCVLGTWHPFHFNATQHCCAQSQDPICGADCKAAAAPAETQHAQTVAAPAKAKKTAIHRTSRSRRYHRRRSHRRRMARIHKSKKH